MPLRGAESDTGPIACGADVFSGCVDVSRTPMGQPRQFAYPEWLMTTADRAPHPWAPNGFPRRADPHPPALLRPNRSTGESAAAAKKRMLLDEHRSQDGLCVRCRSSWPCNVIRSVRVGGTA